MHRLSEIDGVKDPDAVSILQKGLAAVDYDIAFRKRFVNTEIRNSLKNDCFYDKLIRNYRQPLPDRSDSSLYPLLLPFLLC